MTLPKGQASIPRTPRRKVKPAKKHEPSASRPGAKSLRQAQTILETTSSIVYIFDLVTQRDSFANRSLASVLGYPVEQQAKVGSVFMPTDVHPDDAPILREKLAWVTTASDREIGNREYRVRHANGTWRWIGVREMIFSRNQDGTPKEIMGMAQDITERKQAAENLKRSENLLRLVTDNLPAFVAYVSAPDLRYQFVNRQYELSFQHTREEIVGQYVGDVLDPANYEFARPYIERALQGETCSYENTFLFAGEQRWIEVNFVPDIDETGKVNGIVILNHDLTKRKQTEEALRESQEELALFIKHSPIYAFLKQVTPTTSRVLQASENYGEMIGIPGSEMIGKTMAELFPAEFAEKITADDWAVVSSGVVLKLDEDLNDRHYTTIKYPLVLGNKTLLAGYAIDITERKRLEASLRSVNLQLHDQIIDLQNLQNQLRDQAVRDPLTQLYNRRYLNETLPREVALAFRQNYAIGILILDIDHFKLINDTYGHLAGDETLQVVARTLLMHLRASDIVCRYGGEEFLCFLQNTTEEIALQRAQHLCAAIENLPIISAHPTARVTVSIGVALLPPHGRDVIEILKAADKALYQAKADGRNCVRLAEQDLPA